MRNKGSQVPSENQCISHFSQVPQIVIPWLFNVRWTSLGNSYGSLRLFTRIEGLLPKDALRMWIQNLPMQTLWCSPGPYPSPHKATGICSEKLCKAVAALPNTQKRSLNIHALINTQALRSSNSVLGPDLWNIYTQWCTFQIISPGICLAARLQLGGS